MLSYHNIKDMYPEMGVDLDNLGCIMLDTDPVKFPLIEDEDLYFNDDWKHGGGGREENPHTTLRYGLLPVVKRKHVDAVLEHVRIPEQVLLHFEAAKFDSPTGEYEVIIAKVADRSVYEINAALGMLPNINTFPEYHPHITLAYVKAGWWEENMDEVQHVPLPYAVKTRGINYGGMV